MADSGLFGYDRRRGAGAIQSGSGIGCPNTLTIGWYGMGYQDDFKGQKEEVTWVYRIVSSKDSRFATSPEV
jgi:hypothetical protein